MENRVTHKMNNDEVEFTEVFPFVTPLYQTWLHDYDLTNDILKVKSQHPTGVKISNVGGWQSTSYNLVDRNINSNVFMRPVIHDVLQKMKEVYIGFGLSKDPLLTSYWFNVNKKYDYNVMHTHPRAWFSAVYYVRTPENCGNIIFKRPDLCAEWIELEQLNVKNCPMYNVPAEEKKLLIFPSYVEHHVEQNLCQHDADERISIAFNFS